MKIGMPFLQVIKILLQSEENVAMSRSATFSNDLSRVL